MERIFSRQLPQAVLDGPALAPPDGVINIYKPSQTMPLTLTVLCIVLVTICFVARVYAMLIVLKKHTFNEYLLFVSYITFMVMCCATGLPEIYGHGLFRHQWNLELKNLPDLIRLFHIGTCIWLMNVMIIKANILLEWIRIFCPNGTRGFVYWGSLGLLGINCLFNTAMLIFTNLSCTPHAKILDPLVDGTCIDTSFVWITSATLSVVIDVVILLLPQRVIWRLHMDRRRKLGVSSMFAIGLVGIAAAAVRLETTIRFSTVDDVTFVYSEIIMWAIGESAAGIIVFCMPIMPVVLKSLGFSALVSTVKSKYGKPKYGSNSRGHAGPREVEPSPAIWGRVKNGFKDRSYSEIDTVPLETRGSTVALATEAAPEPVHLYERSKPDVRYVIER